MRVEAMRLEAPHGEPREGNAPGASTASAMQAMLALHPRPDAAKGAHMPFRDDVSAVLASLGPEAVGAVADAVADPGGAALALERSVVVLRAAPDLTASAAGSARIRALPSGSASRGARAR